MSKNRKKIVNKFEGLMEERAEGYAFANSDSLFYSKKYRTFVRKGIDSEKTFILGCGGAGAEPLYIGFVGFGGLDAACDGQIYTAPSAYSLYQFVKSLKNSKIVMLSGNFDGDFMNNEMAKGMLELEGKEIIPIYIKDDIGSSLNNKEKRGGVVGLTFAISILGAASELKYSFGDFLRLKQFLETSIFTMSVTLENGAYPGTGKPMGTVDEDLIEFGKGFNGEKGIKESPMMSADEMTDTTLQYIIDDMELKSGERVSVIIGGLGATSLMELFLVMRRVSKRLEQMNVIITSSKVGEFHAVQETKGFHISIIRLNKELERLLNYPIVTPHFTNITSGLFMEKYLRS